MNDVRQAVWSITGAQADNIIHTAVRDAIDVNEGEEGIIFISRSWRIRLAFHSCVGDICGGCINIDLDDNAGVDNQRFVF